MEKKLNPFVYQKPTEKSIMDITNIRDKCNELYDLLCTSVPQSREKSLAITKLEEVSMWANKAIVFNQYN